MKFRPVREYLSEAMAEVVTVNTFDELKAAAIPETLRQHYGCNPKIEVTYQEWDSRIGWDSHIVTVNGQVVGYTDGCVDSFKTCVPEVSADNFAPGVPFAYVCRDWLRHMQFMDAVAVAAAPLECKCYKTNDFDFYAAVITGCASEWTVTENCPIHRNKTPEAKPGDEVWIRGKIEDDPLSPTGRVFVTIGDYVAAVEPKNIITRSPEKEIKMDGWEPVHDSPMHDSNETSESSSSPKLSGIKEKLLVEQGKVNAHINALHDYHSEQGRAARERILELKRDKQ